MKINNIALLDILACPQCRGKLTLLTEGEDHIGLRCDACQVVYPIEEGVPIMLVDQAVPSARWAEEERKMPS